MTIIDYAKKRDLEGVRRCINEGVDVKLQDNDGISALMFACCDMNEDIAKLLISAGANIDLQNNDGISVLMCASMFGYKDVVEMLIENGANVYLQNNKGKTAIDYDKSPFSKILYKELSFSKKELTFIYVNKYIIPDLTNIVLEWS